MSSFDDAETCESVGSYLSSKLNPEGHSNIGLYRDDGLATFNKSLREIENIKKHICKIFNDHGLRLTIEANKKCVNYLGITRDLRSGTYKPFNKPGNIPQYVNCRSNHLPSILRCILKAINKRQSNSSSHKQSFDSTIRPYQFALKERGYEYNLEFDSQPPKTKTLAKKKHHLV